MRSNYISIEEKFRYFSDCVAASSEIESFFFLCKQMSEIMRKYFGI